MKLFFIYALLCATYGDAQTCPCDNSQLCSPITSRATREIFAFHLADSKDWPSYDWTTITTVAIFGGTTVEPALYCHAHSRGVRVVLVATYFNWTQLTSAVYRTTWATAWAADVAAARVDGLNLDLEGASYIEAPRKDLVTAVAAEVASLIRAANTFTQISFDLSIRPRDYSTGYDFAALSTICEFLIP